MADGYEKVDHPPHYGGESNPFEAIKIIEAHDLNFNRGNVVKYVLRAGKVPDEDEVKDLEKAAWYVNREIKRVRRLRASGSPVAVANVATGEPDDTSRPMPWKTTRGSVEWAWVRGYDSLYPNASLPPDVFDRLTGGLRPPTDESTGGLTVAVYDSEAAAMGGYRATWSAEGSRDNNPFADREPGRIFWGNGVHLFRWRAGDESVEPDVLRPDVFRHLDVTAAAESGEASVYYRSHADAVVALNHAVEAYHRDAATKEATF